MRLLLLVFGLLLFIPGYSQNSTFSVKHYDEKYLSQSSIHDLMIDDNGFLWLTTNSGLVRFDGREFKIFNRANTPALKSSRFSLSNNNSKHIIGEFGYLYKIDSTASPVISYPIRMYKNLFFESKGELNQYKQQLRNDFGRNYDFLVERSQKKEIVNSKSGVAYLYDSQVLSIVDSTNIVSFNASFISNFFLFSDIFICDIVYNEQRFFQNGREVRKEDIFPSNLKKENLKNTFFKYYSCNNSEAYLHLGNDFYKVEIVNGKLVATLIFKNFAIPNITKIIYSKTSNIYFIATLNNGFYTATPNTFNCITTPASEDLSNVMYAALVLDDNKILVSNGSVYDKKTQQFSRGLQLVNQNGVYFQDSKQRIWYHKHDTLFCADKNLKSQRAYDLKSVTHDKMLRISCMFEDKNGVIWFNSEYGIHQIVNDELVLKNITPELNIPRNAYIETFIFLHDQLLWVGTTSGIIRVDLKNKKILPVLLSNSDVRRFYKDKQNNLFIGTYDNGFYLYKDEKLVKMPLDKYKNLLSSHDFIEDKFGFLWISSNNGLYKVSKQSLLEYVKDRKHQVNYFRYTIQDGFLTNEFNGGSSTGVFRWNSLVVFPSMRGLVTFNPDQEFNLEISNQIFVNGVLADNVKLSESERFSLNPEFNQLFIDITAPYFRNRDNLIFQYKLKGLNSNSWVDVAEDGRITLTRLPYGEYELVIRKLVDFRENIYSYKTISFSVNPFFHQTIWFRIGIVIFLCGIIFLGFYSRTRLLRKQRNLLQQEVGMKTKDLKSTIAQLNNMVSALENSKKELLRSNQLRTKLTSILVHDLKSPLRFLSMVSNKIYKNTELLSKEEMKEMAFEMKEYSKNITAFIDEFIVWQEVQKEGFKPADELLKVSEIIDEIVNLYTDIIKRNGNRISRIYEDENLMINTDRHILKTIIRNLVDNANKYTSNGCIEVRVYLNENQPVIEIKDSGEGLTKEKIDQIYLQKDEVYGYDRSNMGYKIILGFAKKINCVIDIQSEGEGLGSKVTLFTGQM